MPPESDVLLVVNCQRPPAERNRRLLRALYADRFPTVVFTAWDGCAPTRAGRTLRTGWTPRLRDNRCACCPPEPAHPAGFHATHPRLVQVAELAEAEGFAYVVFTEDDCLLSPRFDPAFVRRRCAEVDALIPFLDFCDRDASTWVWTHHPTGYPAFDRAAQDHGFDRTRMLRYYAEFSGQPEPPVLYPPMFGAFVDCLVFRTETLTRMAPDLLALQDVWHEAAIPSALIHQTPRVGRLDGVALWGDDRNRPHDELFALLDGQDYVHPIKLSQLTEAEALAAYRRAGARRKRPARRAAVVD